MINKFKSNNTALLIRSSTYHIHKKIQLNQQKEVILNFIDCIKR